MKLIIAGSRTFTDYQLLCQILASERHCITQVITGGTRGADQLGYRWAWKHAIRHQLFRAEWERFGKPVCAAITRWRRPAICSSHSGMGAPQARPIWCSACSSLASQS
jgi:YspA, cpYpsA-related SLOG family